MTEEVEALATRKGPVEQAAGKSRLDALIATRDRLARALDQVDDRYTASVAKQLGEVLLAIDAIQPQEVSAVDDLEARRAKRRSAASRASGAAGAHPGGGAGSGRARGKRGTGS